MNVLENCIILLKLFYLCLWNTASCKHLHQDIDCLLSNNDRLSIDHIMWKQVRRSRRGFTPPEPPSHQGPPRTNEYDPNYGYEPYWATGDWVFEVQPKVKGDMCGQVCSQHYRDYGVICGRRRDRNLSMQHKTFSNYCEMMNEDCDRKSVWLIAYRGACQPLPKTYPTRAVLFVSRAKYYMTLFMKNTPTESFIFKTTRSKRRTTTKKS